MKTLGVYSSGGGNAGIKLRNQMRRLFGCTVTTDPTKKGMRNSHGELAVIADSGVSIWWNPDNNSALHGVEQHHRNSVKTCSTTKSSTILVPLDLTNPHGPSSGRPLGLDLYLWLVYRTFALRAPLRLSWPTLLYRQFGVHPDKGK